MAVLTLAEFRDSVRRRIEITPIYDQTGVSADKGIVPPGQPDPNNFMMNTAINDAISKINRFVRVGNLQELSIAVTAVSTQRGPLSVDISSQIPAGTSFLEVTNISWDTGAGSIFRLEPVGYYTKPGAKPGYEPFQQYTPGTPRQFLVVGNQIQIMPPPSANGTLRFAAATVIAPLVNDSDTIATTVLPADMQQVVEYIAVIVLSARKASDVESMNRLQSYTPLAAQGVTEIYAWKNGENATGIESVRATLNMTPLGLTVNPAARGGGMDMGGGQQQGQ